MVRQVDTVWGVVSPTIPPEMAAIPPINLELPMGSFLEKEKVQQARFRACSPYFSAAARVAGAYRGTNRSFCLPVEYAEENLFPGIRQAARAYFHDYGIQWHDGRDRNPSNHLCSSQVC